MVRCSLLTRPEIGTLYLQGLDYIHGTGRPRPYPKVWFSVKQPLDKVRVQCKVTVLIDVK